MQYLQWIDSWFHTKLSSNDFIQKLINDKFQISMYDAHNLLEKTCGKHGRKKKKKKYLQSITFKLPITVMQIVAPSSFNRYETEIIWSVIQYKDTRLPILFIFCNKILLPPT